MTIRYYILPRDEIINPTTGNESYGPKYIWWQCNPPLATHDGLQIPWSGYYYGIIPAMLIAADVSQEQHDQLVAETDVAGAPIDIDTYVTTAAIPKIQTVLEALRIPAMWVDETYTYRQLLRMVAGLFQFSDAYFGQYREALIDNQAQLDLTWEQVPIDRREKIKTIARQFRWDYAIVTREWSVRQTLKYLADQWGSARFKHQLGVL